MFVNILLRFRNPFFKTQVTVWESSGIVFWFIQRQDIERSNYFWAETSAYLMLPEISLYGTLSQGQWNQ